MSWLVLGVFFLIATALTVLGRIYGQQQKAINLIIVTLIASNEYDHATVGALSKMWRASK